MIWSGRAALPFVTTVGCIRLDQLNRNQPKARAIQFHHPRTPVRSSSRRTIVPAIETFALKIGS